MNVNSESGGAGWLPEETPLAMPAQNLAAKPAHAFHVTPPGEWRVRECHIWRVVALVFTAVLMWIAGYATREVLMVDGFSGLDLAALVLFELLFGWITFSAVVSLIGLAASWSGDSELKHLSDTGPVAPVKGRTAILMPVYNEEPEPVQARLSQMAASLAALGAGEAFDIFVLSDSRNPDIQARETLAFEGLRAAHGHRVYYRRRAENEGRKAGNIAEWVGRFGGAYDYMVVLDADSLMTGDTLLRLIGAMDAHPRLGLLQTMPRLINRVSLFGRMQQFANRLYGPTMTRGLALMWGSEGNYWGHNAAIRVRAFAQCAGLPLLKGPGPFGGEIRSHDFVEAALLRRAGWEVRMAPQLSGSYEEAPPTLPDLMVRDRRWCQGNLQHLGVVNAAGLNSMSRFHLLYGAMGYMMSPLWLTFLIVTALLSLEGRGVVDSEWNDYNISVLRWVLSIAFVCLFVPKIVALGHTLVAERERRDWGRLDRLIAGVALETALSTLIAPVMMVSQIKALSEIVRGKDSGWSAQTRGDGSISWADACRKNVTPTFVGVALGVFFYMLSPAALMWASPTVLGLLLSAPLTVATASPRIGAWFLDWKLLATPEEHASRASAAASLALIAFADQTALTPEPA
ncbi:MAG TPA: glucans biosynthesis glucosyltransferase MdoH [Caulobacteraceae bacterium]|nr:glucans biosynthesis glucosyltransferase MdoH [Caulobacteraceae bacterium]